MNGKSPLAIQADGQWPIVPRRFAVWGYCLHTTGRGLPEKALKLGKDPMDMAIHIYLGTKPYGDATPHGPCYVIGWHGEIVQLADDSCRTAHVGSAKRRFYMDGSWATRAPAKAVEHWRKAWPKFKSPSHLYPPKAPNDCYVGCEMIPLIKGADAKPWKPGLLFSEAQHLAAAKLGRDLARRHAWPAGWARSSRLVSHEDIGLLDRSNAAGGWDVGYLRDQPYFDMEWVRYSINEGA